jgi:tyrosyl-tRNA synthetase
MLAKDSVRSRVQSEHGISFTEFSYMLLQANDFWHLHQAMGCEVQVGGSDQWGNITAGIDLIRRRDGAGVHGLTVPLVTRSDGQKFGKSVEGTSVWLDPAKTSPYELYQYFVNVDDQDARRFLLQLTLTPVAEVDEIMAAHEAEPGRRHAQRRLAEAMTALVHGEAAAADAARASQGFTQAVDSLSAADLERLAAEIPTTEVPATELDGLDLVDLVVRTGLEASKGAARRTIEGGGLYVNDVAAAPGRSIGPDDVRHGRYVLLRKGKRTRHLVVVG